MKYYLNESIKYILSERFVLNEALKHSDLIVQCEAICDSIKKLLDELENGTDETKAKEDALNKIFDRTTSLRQDIRKVNDVEIIKGKAKDYIDAIQSLISVVDPSTYDSSITADNKTTAFGKFFAHLNGLIEDPGVKKLELTSELGKIDTIVQTAIDGLANITNSAAETKTKDEQIVALTKAYKLIYKVSQSSEKEYDNNETISEVIEELNKAAEDLNKAIKAVIEAKDDDASVKWLNDTDKFILEGYEDGGEVEMYNISLAYKVSYCIAGINNPGINWDQALMIMKYLVDNLEVNHKSKTEGDPDPLRYNNLVFHCLDENEIDLYRFYELDKLGQVKEFGFGYKE